MAIPLRTNSEPSTQDSTRNSTKYCYKPPADYPTIKDILDSKVIKEEYLSSVARAALQVSFLNASRISEILSLRVLDVIGYDIVLVRGAKRSASYTIFLPGLTNQLILMEVTDVETKLFPIKYKQLWREAKRANISHRRPNRGNSVVTHWARYHSVQKAKIRGFSSRDQSDLLRHRSGASLSYYLSEESNNG